MKKQKGYSSRKLGSKYYWARGYAAFTVDRSSFQRVAIYIEKQEEHHRKGKLNQEEEPPFLNP
ncbi:MAG: transposase [Leptospiraceae bacterium]|nr:transposase [Leptospiraceae bacterium]